jgi:hypothetical protein
MLRLMVRFPPTGICFVLWLLSSVAFPLLLPVAFPWLLLPVAFPWLLLPVAFPDMLSWLPLPMAFPLLSTTSPSSGGKLGSHDELQACSTQSPT